MLDQRMPKTEQMRRFNYCFDDITSFGDFMDFYSFYQKAVDAAPHGATIVEMGCYYGRSLVCLGLMAKEANKGLKIIGVDSGIDMNPSCNTNPHVRKQLTKAGLADSVTFIEQKSVEAAKGFADNSIWLFFLDGGHLHDIVEADIKAWMPKVRDDGWYTGHDFIMYTVAEPVINMFGHDNIIYDARWQDIFILKKQDPKPDANVRQGTYMPTMKKDAWNP